VPWLVLTDMGCRLCPNSLQILQFSSGFFILWEYRHIPCFGSDAVRMFGTFYFTYFYVGAVLMLFMHFFYVNYLKPSKGGKGKPTSSNGVTANGNGHHKASPKEVD
jgi:hypothetical protein